MGTRHLIAVQYKNEYKIAQYGQWDGYLEGQGSCILKFLTEDFNKEKFIEGLLKCEWISKEMMDARWAEFGVDSNDSFVDYKVANKFTDKYPELSRDAGYKILDIVQNAKEKLYLQNDINFVYDGLYCEFAYVIDLDKNTFESYCGFQKYKLDKSERFYKESSREYKSISQEYYGSKLIKAYNLNDLPTEEKYLEECSKILEYDEEN